MIILAMPPAGDGFNSRGQRPRQTCHYHGPTLKGSNPRSVVMGTCAPAQGNTTPSGSERQSSEFPGALPPAINSCPCRAPRKVRSSLLLTVVLTGSLVACHSKAPSGPVDFFPAGNSVAGWVKSSETQTFEASHLWEYIDGDADKYLKAGVVKTLTSDYRFNGKIDATVDVYVMGDAVGARRIFESESAEGSQPATVGDAARYAKGSLTFRQGPYFVRLVAYDDAPEIVKGMADLASAVSRRLAKPGGS